MSVIPGDPWLDIRRESHDDDPKRNRDGETVIDGSQSNETPVAAISQAGISADEILKRLPSHDEGADGESLGQEFWMSMYLKRRKSGRRFTSIASGDNPNDKRPRPDENVSKSIVIGGRETAKVLENVEPMASHCVFWGG